MAHIKKTICPLDCPDTCGLLATVEEGKVTSLAGDPEHPYTNGVLSAVKCSFILKDSIVSTEFSIHSCEPEKKVKGSSRESAGRRLGATLS